MTRPSRPLPSDEAASGEPPAPPAPQTMPRLLADIVREDTGRGEEPAGSTAAAPGCWSDAAWSVSGVGVDAAIGAAVAAVADWPGLIETPSDVVIALSSDEEVAALNAEFRGQPKPTNVLSFPAGGFARPTGTSHEVIHRASLGDIILAEETLIREADDLGIPRLHHLQHLVIHGLLHLLGFDHDTDEAAALMEGLETSILSHLGVKDPYSEGAETSHAALDRYSAGGEEISNRRP